MIRSEIDNNYTANVSPIESPGKMDDLFQRHLGSISIILNLSKKIWWKLKSHSFHQKKFEEFWWKLKAYRPYP